MLVDLPGDLRLLDRGLKGILSFFPAGIDKDEIFTTSPRETPVHIVPWAFLGEAFPFFKPNFTKMEEYGRDMGADEVRSLSKDSWAYLPHLRSVSACAFHVS